VDEGRLLAEMAGEASASLESTAREVAARSAGELAALDQFPDAARCIIAAELLTTSATAGWRDFATALAVYLLRAGR
jgi:hypothetical protein